MTEHNIEIPCNTEVVIRVSCKEVVTEPILVAESVLEPSSQPVGEPIPVTDPDPVVEPELIPVIVDTPVIPTIPTPLVEPTPVATPEPTPTAEPAEHCYCDLDSPLSLTDFVKQLNTLSKGLLYPSESDFPIDVLPKGFSSKMPNVKGIEVRNLDRVIPPFLRTENSRWQSLYDFIKHHASVTAWHYPVKQNKYTHELMVLLLHPQGTVALRIKLVET